MKISTLSALGYNDNFMTRRESKTVKGDWGESAKNPPKVKLVFLSRTRE